MLRNTAGMLAAALVAVPILTVTPAIADEDHVPAIQMGEWFFSVPGGPEMAFVPSEAQPQSIMVLTGAETGKIELMVENVGTVVHEIRSPLFMAAKEVKAEIFDAAGEYVAESEGTDLLELELAPGYSAVLHISLAGAVSKSFAKDPALTLDYEISCHSEGHYEDGMRALITLTVTPGPA